MYNADGEDGLAFAVFESVKGGESLFLTDNSWDGSALGTSEGTLQWTAPSGGLETGTVVVISNINAGAEASVGTVSEPDVDFNLAANGDNVYAYVGALGVPSAFLYLLDVQGGTAETNNTGLSEAGNTALALGNGIDGGQYTNARNNQATFAAYLPQIADLSSSWETTTGDGTIFNQYDQTPFVVTTSSTSTSTTTSTTTTSTTTSSTTSTSTTTSTTSTTTTTTTTTSTTSTSTTTTSTTTTTTTSTSSTTTTSSTTHSTSSSTTSTSTSTTTSSTTASPGITQTEHVYSTNFTLYIFEVLCPPNSNFCGEIMTQKFFEVVGFNIMWPSKPGRMYSLDERILPNTNWMRILSDVPATPPVNTYSNLYENATNQSAIYRIMEQ